MLHFSYGCVIYRYCNITVTLLFILNQTLQRFKNITLGTTVIVIFFLKKYRKKPQKTLTVSRLICLQHNLKLLKNSALENVIFYPSEVQDRASKPPRLLLRCKLQGSRSGRDRHNNKLLLRYCYHFE
jgi:hypothetical protein